MTHPAPSQSRTSSRRLTRLAGVVGAVAVAALALAPGAAVADTPEGWDAAPDVSGLDFLLVLVLIPIGLFLVIALLAALPSMISEKGYEPGQAWRSEPEWFGGASKGVEAAEGAAPEAIESAEADRGGASGSW